MLDLLNPRRTHRGIIQGTHSPHIPLAGVIIMMLPNRHSLILNFKRFLLRLTRILVNLRVQMILHRHRRPTRHETRRTLNLPHNHKPLHQSDDHTNNNRLLRNTLLVQNMPLSNTSRIQSRIITTLRLRISLHPYLLGFITRTSRPIMRSRTGPSRRSCSRGGRRDRRNEMTLVQVPGLELLLIILLNNTVITN